MVSEISLRPTWPLLYCSDCDFVKLERRGSWNEDPMPVGYIFGGGVGSWRHLLPLLLLLLLLLLLSLINYNPAAIALCCLARSLCALSSLASNRTSTWEVKIGPLPLQKAFENRGSVCATEQEKCFYVPIIISPINKLGSANFLFRLQGGRWQVAVAAAVNSIGARVNDSRDGHG